MARRLPNQPRLLPKANKPQHENHMPTAARFIPDGGFFASPL
jgi:hypothetical protein